MILRCIFINIKNDVDKTKIIYFNLKIATLLYIYNYKTTDGKFLWITLYWTLLDEQ